MITIVLTNRTNLIVQCETAPNPNSGKSDPATKLTITIIFIMTISEYIDAAMDAV